MKMTLEQAEVRFGKETINKLVNMPAEPTGRLIYPSSEPPKYALVKRLSISW